MAYFKYYFRLAFEYEIEDDIARAAAEFSHSAWAGSRSGCHKDLLLPGKSFSGFSGEPIGYRYRAFVAPEVRRHVVLA